MVPKKSRERAGKLRKTIQHHRYLYHGLDKEEISPAALDSLKGELTKLEEKYPELELEDRIPFLEPALRGAKTGYEKQRICWYVDSLKLKSAVPLILGILDTESGSVYATAVRTLNKLRAFDVLIPKLIEHLTEKDGKRRQRAT